MGNGRVTAMKRMAVGVVALALLLEPTLVFAQQNSQDAARDAREQAAEKKREDNNELLRQYHQKQKENAVIEKQYERTLRATDTGAAPTRVDPWANMR
jgi:phage terminase large subunit GpA-like protein